MKWELVTYLLPTSATERLRKNVKGDEEWHEIYENSTIEPSYRGCIRIVFKIYSRAVSYFALEWNVGSWSYPPIHQFNLNFKRGYLKRVRMPSCRQGVGNNNTQSGFLPPFFRQTCVRVQISMVELKSHWGHNKIQYSPDNNNFFGSQKLLLTEHCY